MISNNKQVYNNNINYNNKNNNNVNNNYYNKRTSIYLGCDIIVISLVLILSYNEFFRSFILTPALKYMITNISRSQLIFWKKNHFFWIFCRLSQNHFSIFFWGKDNLRATSA